MKLCVFDVETANEKPTSVCSIGLYLIVDGVIIDSFYSLVKPLENRFLPFNIAIHHITHHDVVDAPTFQELWTSMHWYFEDSILVAHNAGFDVGCLEACLVEAGLELPEVRFADTVLMSRKIWPDLVNHKLNTCAEAMGVDFLHHNALDDSYACARIVLEVFKLMKTTSMEEVYAEFGWNLGVMTRTGIVRKPKVERPRYTLVRPEVVNTDSYYYQKKICFTTKLGLSRREAMQAVLNNGGFLMDFVDETLDILVVNNQTFENLDSSKRTSKLKKALSLIRLGCPIEIFSETMFMSILENAV